MAVAAGVKLSQLPVLASPYPGAMRLHVLDPTEGLAADRDKAITFTALQTELIAALGPTWQTSVVVPAQQARDQAIAAAEASGAVRFYNTKAEANADLLNVPNLVAIEVFADESQGGKRTRYRKEAGVLVFKLAMPGNLPTAAPADAKKVLAVNGGGSGYQVSSALYSDVDKVGIGIATPQAKLHIFDASTTVYIHSGNTTATTIGEKNCRLVMLNNTSTIGGGHDIVFAATDEPVDRWGSIGSHVMGNSISGSVGYIFIATKATTADTALIPRLVVQETGRIGIGTTTPTDLLQLVSDTSGATGIIHNNSGSNGIPRYMVKNDTGNFAGIYIHGSTVSTTLHGLALGNDAWVRSTSNIAITAPGHIRFGNDGAVEYARFTSAGRLGIGTIAPAQQLHVSGGNMQLDLSPTVGWLYWGGTNTGINGDTGTLGSYVVIKTDGANRLMVDGDGHMTLASNAGEANAWHSNYKRFKVNFSTVMVGTNTEGGYFGSNFYIDSTSAFLYQNAASYASHVLTSSGLVRLQTSGTPSVAAGDAITWTHGLTVHRNGWVRLGDATASAATNPTALLDVIKVTLGTGAIVASFTGGDSASATSDTTIHLASATNNRAFGLRIVVSTTDAANGRGNASFRVRTTSGGTYTEALNLYVDTASTATQVRVNGAAGTTTGESGMFTKGVTVLGLTTANLTAGKLENSSVQLWLNEAGNILNFQVKYSTGTVKTGSVALV